jgi:hypothetical protein
MLTSRLLLAAALAAVLGAAPLIAQDVDQGDQSQSDQILKKKKKKMDTQEGQQLQGQDQGEMQSKKKKRSQDAATTGDDQDNSAKKLKKRQQASDTDEDQAGQMDRKKRKKLRKTEEDKSDQVSKEEKSKTFVGLPAEKRTVFRQKLVSRNVQRVQRSKLKFRIGVGVKVPRTIRFYPLPPDVVQFVPAYRGYVYFVTEDGLVVILNPRTFEIVSVFPA